MSNAVNVTSSQKPCFRFMFPDQDSAESFFKYASQERDATRVQHPYGTGRVTQDKTKVYVSGTGSLVFDLKLREQLNKAATKLGGHMPEE